MEQARIEHAPNGSLLTYITSADALVNNWYSSCIPIALFDLIYTFAKKIEKIISIRLKIKVKTLCSYYSHIQKSTGKIRTPYFSSNWIEMVFIIEEIYEENET